MKEATGELNMTVITIVAIALIAGLFVALWPTIKGKVEGEWNNASNSAHKADNNTSQKIGG